MLLQRRPGPNGMERSVADCYPERHWDCERAHFLPAFLIDGQTGVGVEFGQVTRPEATGTLGCGELVGITGWRH